MRKLIWIGVAALLLPGLAPAVEMKPHHQQAGLECDSCHQSTPFEAVSMDGCLACHELPQQKQQYHGEPDEHDSPHYGVKLECENCHMEHEESFNFCNDCHEFEFQVP